MLMTRNDMITLLGLSLTLTCSQTNTTNNETSNYQLAICQNAPDLPSKIPNLRLEISMDDSVINRGGTIDIDMLVTNVDTCAYRLLLDHPQYTQYGPWATSASVRDSTGKSVVEYEDASRLSSTLYLGSQLDSFEYILYPHKPIKHKAELLKIVMFDGPYNTLDVGTYRVQLTYYNVKSNILSFEIIN